jgi:hypothetical protein
MNQELSTPQGFIRDVIERDFYFSPEKIPSIWMALQRRETFTKGQLFPYRVEFAANAQEGEFLPGELNIHHGPLLSVHGAIGEVTPHYRSLNYYYGSYVFSFRLVRPVQLEFFQNGDRISLKLNAYIRPWFRPVWRLCNFILWSAFQFSFRS